MARPSRSVVTPTLAHRLAAVAGAAAVVLAFVPHVREVGAAGGVGPFGDDGSVTAYSMVYDYGWVAILLLAAGTWVTLLDGYGLPVPSGLPWAAGVVAPSCLGAGTATATVFVLVHGVDVDGLEGEPGTGLLLVLLGVVAVAASAAGAAQVRTASRDDVRHAP